MDPNAALISLLEAIENRDRIGANVYYEALFRWLNKGGFPPNTQAAIETLRERMRDTQGV